MLILPLSHLPASEDEDQLPPLTELVGKLLRIETTGRGNFQGMLLSVLEDRVELENSDGEILQISRKAISNYQVIEASKKGRAFHQDSASNRLIVAPTAFPMEKGEFHIADQELAIVTASYGLNNFVSFWGGICPLGAVINSRFIASFSESFAVSAGSFVGIEWIGMISDNPSGLVLPYGLFSLGKANNNFTAGGGAVFIVNSESGFETIGAIAMLGGKIVLTATTALVTENWVIWGKRYSPDSLVSRWRAYPLLIIPGLVFRIAGSRFSWDLGALLPLGFFEDGGTLTFGGAFDGLPIPIPWLAVTYRIR
jgi:hypothetical protein